MAELVPLFALLSLASLLLGRWGGEATSLAGLLCPDTKGAVGPSIVEFLQKTKELSDCADKFRKKFGRNSPCGGDLRGKACVVIQDLFESFLKDLSSCRMALELRESTPAPRDCEDVLEEGETGDVVTTIFPDGLTPVLTRCIQGATVILNRNSLSPGFNKSFAEYAAGFGDRHTDYYIGNEALYSLTSSQDYKLRVDVVRQNGTPQFAEYEVFRVGSAGDNYRLTVSRYSGNSGDALSICNGKPFTTYDRVDDTEFMDVLRFYNGGGFWYFPNIFIFSAGLTASNAPFSSLYWDKEKIKAARLSLIRFWR